jgi:serine/threonine protein kinase
MNQPDQQSWRERTGVPTLMPDTAQPGTLGAGVRIGNFELQTLLGRGGMGEVWKAWDKKAERPVVIKLVPRELQRADEEMARVRDTFRRVHALQHQHICPLYLLDEDLRLGWYLVMKYIDGQTLSSYRVN